MRTALQQITDNFPALVAALGGPTLPDETRDALRSAVEALTPPREE